MLAVFAMVLMCASVAHCDDRVDDLQKFTAWMASYGRTYSSVADFHEAFLAFAETDAQIKAAITSGALHQS